MSVEKMLDAVRASNPNQFSQGFAEEVKSRIMEAIADKKSEILSSMLTGSTVSEVEAFKSPRAKEFVALHTYDDHPDDGDLEANYKTNTKKGPEPKGSAFVKEETKVYDEICDCGKSDSRCDCDKGKK